MGIDEEATLRALTARRATMDGLIARHRGRIVNTAGDSVLAEFASVVDAVRCAVEVQDAIESANAADPVERRMRFRIGVNLGDVLVDGGDLYGEAWGDGAGFWLQWPTLPILLLLGLRAAWVLRR